jgi:hypothetical protein
MYDAYDERIRRLAVTCTCTVSKSKWIGFHRRRASSSSMVAHRYPMYSKAYTTSIAFYHTILFLSFSTLKLSPPSSQLPAISLSIPSSLFIHKSYFTAFPYISIVERICDKITKATENKPLTYHERSQSQTLIGH